MDFIFTIVEFFVTGGPFMYPILIVFALGSAIAVERYITLTLMRSSNESAWGRILPLLTNGEFDQARETLSEDTSTIAKLLNMGLARQGAGWRVETSAGPLSAEWVVIAAGQWAREVGHLAGVELPIVPLEGHHLVRQHIEGQPRRVAVR